MHDAGIPRLKLHTPHVLGAVDRNRDRELAEDILPASWKYVGWHFDDEIRLAQPPPGGPLRQCRQIKWTAFDAAFGHPLLDARGLLVTQPALADKRTTIAWLGLPGWHSPGADLFRD